MRVLAYSISGLALFVVCSVAGLVLFFDPNWIKTTISERASAALGRAFVIDGDLSIDWSLRPTLNAERIRLENVAWTSSEQMVTIEKLAAQIDLTKLAQLQMEFPRIDLTQLVVMLEKSEHGTANWEFGSITADAAGEATEADDRVALPIVGALNIDNGRITYRDPTTGIDLAARVAKVIGKGEAGDRSLALTDSGATWDFFGIEGVVGDSDISGDIKIEVGGERPSLSATLASRTLRFEDLEPLIGTDGERRSGTPTRRDIERAMPYDPIDFTRLRTMNGRIEFTGERTVAPNIPLESVRFIAELNDGVLVLDPVEVGIADGILNGIIALNGREESLGIDTDIDFRNLSLRALFESNEFFDTSTGRFGGRLRLTSQGASLASILAASNGRVILAMTGGTIDALAIEAAGFDIGEALLLTTDRETGVPIHCAVIDFPIQNGLMTAQTIVFDTRDTRITGEGTINLADERVRLDLKPHPNTANSPATAFVRGTFADPYGWLDPTPLTVRGEDAATLETLLTPLAALAPIIELSLGEDSDCTALLDDAREFTE